MSTVRRLRTVKNVGAPANTSGGVLAAITYGDNRALLAAMGVTLAKAIDDPNTPPRDLAALTRRLIDVNKAIQEIDARRADREQQEAAEATEDEDGLGDI